jgi:peptidoglycan/LPS O-acetylase OafA/YrhL
MVHVVCLFAFNIVVKRLAGGEAYIRLWDDRPLMLVDPLIGDVAMVLAVAAVLVVSRYSYAWIEEPGRRFGRRLAARLEAAPVAAPEGARA